jgi:hypothetical protein
MKAALAGRPDMPHRVALRMCRGAREDTRKRALDQAGAFA